MSNFQFCIPQRQKEQQQQQELTPPILEAKPSLKPLPTLSSEELDEKRLRKFQKRMENYGEEYKQRMDN